MLFGLPFLLTPAVAIGLSWWVVGKQSPRLILWAIFGVAIASLPGQCFVINDSIFQQHLFWPVFLGLFVRLSPAKRVVLFLLALLQLSHPIGIVLLGIGVVAGAVMAMNDAPRRGELAAGCLLLACVAIAGAVKLRLYPDAQASDEFHLLVLQNRWRKGVSGPPLAGLAWFWICGLFLLVRGWADPKRRPVLSTLLALAGLAAIVPGLLQWLPWAADEHQWAFALDYRRWLVPLTVPFFAFCAWDAGRAAHRRSRGYVTTGPRDEVARSIACLAATGVFAVILIVQSNVWQRMTSRLVAESTNSSSPIVTRSSIHWIENTPMQHWATVPYLAVLRGREPDRILLYDPADRGDLMQEEARVPIAPWSSAHIPPEPGRAGWYDFRPLTRNIQAGK
jgi:hypothetical protein